MASLFKCVLSSRAFTIENNVKILNEVKAYRAFSLCWWPASMQIYWNVKKVFAVEKSSTPTGLVWGTNITTIHCFGTSPIWLL